MTVKIFHDQLRRKYVGGQSYVPGHMLNSQIHDGAVTQ